MATKQKRRRRGRARGRGRGGNPMASGPKAGLTIGLLTMAVSGGFWLADRSKKKRGGCGARYRYLVTTVTGQTLADPYGWIPTSADYEEWKALAQELTATAIQHFDELGKVECERSGGTNCGDPENASGGSYPRWNALVDDKNRLVERADDLPSTWTTLDIPAGITNARAVISDALCLLDRADASLEFYKASIPPLPGLQEAKAEVPWYAWTALAGMGVSAASLIVGAFVQAPRASGGTTIVVRDDDDDDKIIDVEATER